jgi:hypothetical protein
VDIKVLAGGTERVSKLLLEMGLELDGASPTNVGHRFVGRGVRVDVLAPDGVGERARLTTIPPAHKNQRQDLAFLLSLVDDPRAMAEQLDRRERAILRARTELLDPAAPAWRVVDSAEDAHLALRILTAN